MWGVGGVAASRTKTFRNQNHRFQSKFAYCKLFEVYAGVIVFLSSAKDIKLENFMYARKDTDHLKLIDFGLSVMAFCWKKAPWFKTRLTPLEAKSGSPIPKWKLPVAPWATLPPRLDDVFLAKAFEFELGNAKMKAEGI